MKYFTQCTVFQSIEQKLCLCIYFDGNFMIKKYTNTLIFFYLENSKYLNNNVYYKKNNEKLLFKI